MTPSTADPSAVHFDFIVIGGGSGGYAAARTARETCERVAIVDAAPELGGLCILRGCMPSKTLIYSAEVLQHARHGATFGLDIPSARADMQALHRRKVEVIREFAEYRQDQLNSDRFTLFRNRAEFVAPDRILLDDGTCLTADHFLIATGSVVDTPPVPGLAGLPCWTSDDVLDLDFIPEHVIVLGGGVVACELAQFLRRIGAEVTQIQRSPHILKEFSTETSNAVEARFRSEGIRLFTGTHIESIQHQGGQFHVEFKENDEPRKISAPFLLNALGRRAATAGLGLESAGVDLFPGGQIRCSQLQQSSNPRIYAAGDCCGPHEIVHIAIMQGETAARHATGRPASPINLDHLLTVVFTDPQVARVGLTAEQIVYRGTTPISASYPFADHGKSILMAEKDGCVTIHADATDGRILGAECVGRDAGELIHSLAVAVTLGATVHQLLKVHWYHPTLSEIWSYPLEEIAEAVRETH